MTSAPGSGLLVVPIYNQIFDILADFINGRMGVDLLQDLPDGHGVKAQGPML